MIENLNNNLFKAEPIRTIEFNDLKIGTETSFHFLHDTEPLYVLELPIFKPENNFEVVKDYFNTINPLEIIQSAQETNCDILGLKFNIEEQEQIKPAAELLKNLLPQIKKPLMIRGINNNTIDKELLPALIRVLDRECIIAFAEENTYKEIVPEVVKGNHVLVIRTPIDINLAKEMNILTSDLGLSLDKILIDTDIGGLGYGLEYGYSIMEKIKLEGFNGDSYLNMPLISFVGEESLKTKEAKSDSFSESWGEFKNRSILFETASASAIAAAGANIIVLNHPNTIKTMKGLK